MSDLTDYSRDLLARTLCGRLPVPPGAVYAALGTGGSALGLTGEPAGTGYARQRVTFNGTGEQRNATALTFTFTTAPGILTHLGLFDAPSGGNALTISPLSAPALMMGPGSLTIAAAELTVSPG
ncbi:hypothetical protein LPC08_02380 [Roseomonas sp. OT10]|uniref:phage tail fiber protein n=1 Tax=Roseomonas cutis TaxID=2897332 RepID=UPI001E4B35D9|nr:hypothetical protein [Roseomonas sp. OT10]UFN49514.1 hypothetical protein LPC08_02380 [Roseomonas sp. OT10]